MNVFAKQTHFKEQEKALRFQLFAGSPPSAPRREREEMAKMRAALTHRVHMSRRVNPVSNKPGSTLVNPTTNAASATTQSDISGLRTHTRAYMSRP